MPVLILCAMTASALESPDISADELDAPDRGIGWLKMCIRDMFSTVQSHLRFVDCKNDIHSTVFIYPTILGRQAHAVKQLSLIHIFIFR